MSVLSRKVLASSLMFFTQKEFVIMTTIHTGARTLLDQYIRKLDKTPLGSIVERTDIASSMGPFLTVPEYKIHYPTVVIHALEQLYAEYNAAFRPLIEANREWGTDYQHCMTTEGAPFNGWTQVDMVGLPQGFLSAAPNYSESEIREVLRGKIFEIENSLAMYQLLERIFSEHGERTQWSTRFRTSLDDLRKRHGKPIALLAVTDEKYVAMKETEFGKRADEALSSDEVLALSGFDHFFGPQDFLEHVHARDGNCDYLLFVRSSDPVDKLRKPEFAVEQPLLGDPRIRRIIKAHALTFNVDAPDMEPSARINDTKEYMLTMDMAYPAETQDDILTPEFTTYLAQGKTYTDFTGERLSEKFTAYLESQGINAENVRNGDTPLRGKPMKGTYGCYGHVTGTLRDGKFRNLLRTNLRKRGSYVIQPEMEAPVIVNASDGRAYTYIDRNFFSTNGRDYQFIGGLRSLMPVDSPEAQKGRNHGNNSTVWAEIR